MSDACKTPIIYTYTDETPRLATHSLLPVVRAFTRQAGIAVETRDISLAGRIMAAFGLADDALAELGALTQSPQTNIIKLPNISASVPQLKAAIAELQEQGVQVPDYPDSPATVEQREVRARYDAVKGSAVNPVLREGNSDRRVPKAVKSYAQSHPQPMHPWNAQSKTSVATMIDGDFAHSERTVVMPAADTLTIRLRAADGTVHTLKESLPVLAGEVVDASVMSAAALDEFLTAQVAAAQADGMLYSLHLKATMMKVSDPVIFGHAVRAYFPQTFARYGEELAQAGLNANDGLDSIFAGLKSLANGAQIRAAFDAELAAGPAMYMVDSDKGITNLHAPNNVIIDASMPPLIRAGGKSWGPDGNPVDTLAVIPDSSYADVYQAVVEDCKENGALDPTTLGSVPNVGLMAQKAEEYGSHNKTFIIDTPGVVEMVNTAGEVLLSHEVAVGDIWRACQTKAAPIRDWVRLAVKRARLTGDPAVFWLSQTRAHDVAMRALVEKYLAAENTSGLDLRILDLSAATRFTLARARQGLNTISVTGNVLRDYLTDLFPILEVGTSARMLSVVPLMHGGGLFETGAGGSAPKLYSQLLEKNHLGWDSLGEYLALAESLRQLAEVSGNTSATALADALDVATEHLLQAEKSPSLHLGGIDTRGSHAWLARFWAEALADQTADAKLAAVFAPVAVQLRDNIAQIDAELTAGQGQPVQMGGYYRPDTALADQVMRPSPTFNAIIDTLS